MRRYLIVLIAFGFVAEASAHHPDREHQRVHPYYDVIPPLGNRLPASYRRRFNRPSYLSGKLLYWIEPTSQEAMAWHRAVHKGYYRDHAPRMVTYYFSPKPWEVIPMGARKPKSDDTAEGEASRDAPPPSDEEPQVLELEEIPAEEFEVEPEIDFSEVPSASDRDVP